jgi:hypothetical protein
MRSCTNQQCVVQEAAVLKCAKSAVAIQNPTAEAWQRLTLLYLARQEFRSSKEAGVKWLRQAQLPLWHEGDETAAQVAEAAEVLVR